jgi:triacylglycerol lipase
MAVVSTAVNRFDSASSNLSLQPESGASQPQSEFRKNPVLLVHGIWDSGKKFQTLQPYLEAQGWQVSTIDLKPNNGDATLELLAQQVAARVQQQYGHQQIDLVGFSMGGIVSRYYLQRLNGLAQVQRFVTISSPHYGTLTAFGSPKPGAQQMRTNSPFLKDLNKDMVRLEAIQVTSIWTPFDVMIVPADSSHLPFGQEIKLNVAMHHQMLQDRRALEAVERALAVPFERQVPESRSLRMPG